MSGKVENGKRVGIWSKFYQNGKLQEEGKFENGIYKVINHCNLREKLIVENGYGSYRSYYPDETTVYEKGKIQNGYRDGIWQMYAPNSGIVLQELFYMEGKLTGLQKYYYPTGKLYCMGETIDGLREGEWNWYFESENISSTVNYRQDKKEGKQTM